MNTQKNAPESAYIDKKELAKRLHKTPRTIEIWMKQGLLPYIKLGRSCLFNWQRVVSHLEEKFGQNA